MIASFWKFTDQYILFNDSEKEKIATCLIKKSFPKNTLLVDVEDVSKEIYFILKGCIRLYYLTKEGKEITGFVFVENMFAGSHDSYFNQQASTQVLETIEPVEVLTLSYENINKLFREVPRMNEFVRKILTHRFGYAQKVIASLIINKPEERYRQILHERPDLVNRIPHHILASYIGITPVSLSRIRARKHKSD